MPEWRSCSAELVHSRFDSDYLEEEEEEVTASQLLFISVTLAMDLGQWMENYVTLSDSTFRWWGLGCIWVDITSLLEGGDWPGWTSF